MENSQVAAYAGAHRHALIDVSLYLPKSWTDGPGKLAHAGVPDDIEFATKLQLAQRMIVKVLAA
ncbi:transposase [[Mycobacterium] appelbergii]|uniref:transposase n=1 Tax=[Mycobacterium] appelbergii TaxID=2939269 RepID=UPI0039779708